MIGWRPLLITLLIVVVGLTACIVRTRPVHHARGPVIVVPAEHEKHKKHKEHHDNGHHDGHDHDDDDD